MANEFENLDPNIVDILRSIGLLPPEEPVDIVNGPISRPLSEIDYTGMQPYGWAGRRENPFGDMVNRALQYTSKSLKQSMSRPPEPQTSAIFPTEEGLAEPTQPGTAVLQPRKQVGTPQYTSPSGRGIMPPSVPTETPETPTPPATEPPATTPASAAAIPDFSKLIQPWKPKTDFEKESIDMFDKIVPKWEDLPKAKSIEPDTPMGVLTRFVRDVGLGFLGKDIFALKEKEIEKEEGRATQERNYTIQRASQLANFKLSALSKRTEREEADRESTAKWLEYVGNANLEYRKNPSYQAAVASIRGIPVEQAAPLLQSMVNPETGLLEGMYEPPESRLIKQQEALNTWNIKKLTDAGFSKDRAAFSLATGNMDMGAFLMNKYQNAVTNKDKAGMKQAQADIKAYREMSTFDPIEEKATFFLKNSDKIKKSGFFADDASFNFMKTWATSYLLLGKDAAKELKMPTAKDVKINEQVARLAISTLGNSAKEKAFIDKFGISPQTAFQVHYGLKEGQPSPDMPEPFNTITRMFPNTVKNPEKFMGADPLGDSIKTAARDQIVLRYKPLFAEIIGEGINQTPQARAIRKVMRKKSLTDDEIYKIATAANQGDQNALNSIRIQIYATRGLKLKP